MNRLATLTAAAALVLPATVNADDAFDFARAAINANGNDCAQVTSMAAVGRVDNGDALVLAVCSDGVHWMLEIEPGDRQGRPCLRMPLSTSPESNHKMRLIKRVA